MADVIGQTKGLVKLVKEIGPLHKKKFLVHCADLQFRLDKTQTIPLFNEDREPKITQYMKSRIANPYLGQFFQDLAWGIWGGEETDKTTTFFKMIERKGYAPDLTNHKEGIFREIKGVSGTESCDLRENQMAKTIDCLLHDFPIDNPEFNFSIFRYNVRRPMQFIKFATKTKFEESIIEMMKGKVPFILDLPLGVMMAVYYAGSRFGSERYCYGSRFKSSVINGIFRDPIMTLANLEDGVSLPGVKPIKPIIRAGISLENLEWERYKLSEPLKVNGVVIGSPLLLHAHFKDYPQWLDSFRKEYEKLKEDIGDVIKEEFLQWFGFNGGETSTSQ